MMTAHRDVWIFDDLETIAVYYPELEEERGILNTQTVFSDYKTSRTVFKNVAIEQIALGNYDVNDPNFLLSPEQHQAMSSRDQGLMSSALPFYLFPDSHEQYLHAVQWSRYLKKTGEKPGNTLFHQGFYPTYDSGGAEIDRGWFKTRQFYFPDHQKGRALFIRNLANVGEYNAGTPNERGYESTGFMPDIRNDRTARAHCPLTYFPPSIDYGQKDIPVLWDPADPVKSASEIQHKYAGRGLNAQVWANTLIAACTAKNQKITYDQIIRSSGEYGYNITVDLSILGLGVYQWDFEHDLLRFFDPIKFFTQITRKLLDDQETVRWGGSGCNLFGLKNIGSNNPWGLPVVYQVDVDDQELRYYGLAVGAFQARDSWVHNFLVGGMIPVCEPDFQMLHHQRHGQFGVNEPCTSSGKYLRLTPHHQSAWSIFKQILGELLGIGITFGLSFASAPDGLSTISKIINSTISTFQQLADRVLTSAGAPPLVIAAFNYGLYEVCALKIDGMIKEGKDYQSAKKEIKRALASTIVDFSLGLSSSEEMAEIDRAEQTADSIVDYLTIEENKYAPHAKENSRKILAAIAEAQENYIKQTGGQYVAGGKIKGEISVVQGMNVIDTGGGGGTAITVVALAAGALVLAKYLKDK